MELKFEFKAANICHNMQKYVKLASILLKQEILLRNLGIYNYKSVHSNGIKTLGVNNRINRRRNIKKQSINNFRSKR